MPTTELFNEEDNSTVKRSLTASSLLESFSLVAVKTQQTEQKALDGELSDIGDHKLAHAPVTSSYPRGTFTHRVLLKKLTFSLRKYFICYGRNAKHFRLPFSKRDPTTKRFFSEENEKEKARADMTGHNL